MNAVIKGAKAGEKKARQPKIAPDSAQSKTYIKILYGLSEGEVEGLANGLQSVYLEETPLQNPAGGWNFQDVQADFRHGSNDQTYIEGFPDISSESAIGVELKSDAPWIRSVSNTDLDALRIRFKWGPLRQQNAKNGDVNGITIQYAIDLQTDGGTWTEVLNTQISDKTSANYERSHRIVLPKADTGWTVRVRRITPNSTSEYISDKMYVEAITEVIDLKLSYPNTALLGLQYDAETFSNVAKVAVDLKGIKVQVPSNYDPVARTYAGMWDGTFKRAYTNNPAWIYYDICTAKRYALGDRLTSAMLDKWSLYRLAQYCDQMVIDGKGGQEPRFTCNVYLQSTEDAYTILSKLAGVFRAISYWDGNSIVCDADIPQDTYFTYTRANVIDGLFEYSGTRARDRHTVAKVAWDNPKNRYKTEYVYVRDEPAIARLGVRIAEIDAWGCTSEGQAQRAGLWALKSEQLETRTVSFKVGLDGYIPQPGKIIEISDELFAGRANGGRISAVSADRKVITLDRDDVVCRAGDRLVVNSEDGKAQGRIVSSVNGRNITVTTAFDSVAAENVWAVDAQDLKTMKFRVMSITQDDKHQFSITALQYESAKYDAIDFGAFIDERPISIINPTIQAPVTNVLISSETMVQQGLSVETMVITWDQAQGATKYLVEWRKDDGSWIKLPITGSNSVEVTGIYAGNYEARVTAISAFDVSSLPTYSNLTELSGKQGLPPSLAFLHADGLLFGMKLTWGFPATGALDTAYTEIQVSPDGVANIAQLGLFAYPTTTHSIQGMQPNLTRKYRGRLIDRIGNIGPWSEWVSGTTSADASAILDILSGKITETQLAQDLATKISDIDQYDQRISNAEQAVVEVENQVSGILESQENIIDEQGVLSDKINGVYARVNPLTADGDWTADSTTTEATAWDLYSAQILGDQAIAERVTQVQTTVNGNTAIVEEVAQSVNGLYAQKYTKIDVNGKVIGWGGANDGVEGQYVFNVDSLAIGSGDSAGYYPFIFRNTPFTDPVTGTVFPVSAYLKSAMFDYQSVKTAHIEDLAVKNAQIDNGAITTAKIGNAQVDTLQIKGEAVTVASAFSNESTYTAWYTDVRPGFTFQENLTYWEGLFGNIMTVTINRSGGKVRFDATLTYEDAGQLSFFKENGSALNSAEGQAARAVLSIYRGSTLVGRTESPPTGNVGSGVPLFQGTYNMVGVIDDTNATGNQTYTLKFGFTHRLSIGARIVFGSTNSYFKVRSPRLIVTEMKR